MSSPPPPPPSPLPAPEGTIYAVIDGAFRSPGRDPVSLPGSPDLVQEDLNS